MAKCSIAVLAVLILPAAAEAAEVIYDFTGEITSIQNDARNNAMGIVVGSPLRGLFGINLHAEMTSGIGDTFSRYYGAVTDFELAVDELEFAPVEGNNAVTLVIGEAGHDSVGVNQSRLFVDDRPIHSVTFGIQSNQDVSMLSTTDLGFASNLPGLSDELQHRFHLDFAVLPEDEPHPFEYTPSLDGNILTFSRRSISFDAKDLNNLALHWNQDSDLWSDGDFTGDGHVDAADLNELATNWRNTLALTASVPEPSSVLLAVFAVATTMLPLRKGRNILR